MEGWEEEEEEGRSDGFTAAKKKLFLVALRKGETVLAACELVGISNRTAYNHRERDEAFARHWSLAVSMASLPVELIAWERGVLGVEEPVYAYGKFSHMRVRRSDTLLRKLLEGSKPRKYGRARPAAGKKLLKHEREQLEQEIRAQIEAESPSIEEVQNIVLSRVAAIRRHRERYGPPPDDERAG